MFKMEDGANDQCFPKSSLSLSESEIPSDQRIVNSYEDCLVHCRQQSKMLMLVDKKNIDTCYCINHVPSGLTATCNDNDHFYLFSTGNGYPLASFDDVDPTKLPTVEKDWIIDNDVAVIDSQIVKVRKFMKFELTFHC